MKTKLTSLLFKPLSLVRELVGQELERDEAVEVRLTRLKDEADAAAPDGCGGKCGQRLQPSLLRLV